MEMTDAIARILQDIKVGYDNGDPVINSGEYAAICDVLAEASQQEGDIPDASPKVDPKYLAFAIGYSEGVSRGSSKRKDAFPDPELQKVYDLGFDKGFDQFCYSMDYGMFDD